MAHDRPPPDQPATGDDPSPPPPGGTRRPGDDPSPPPLGSTRRPGDDPSPPPLGGTPPPGHDSSPPPPGGTPPPGDTPRDRSGAYEPPHPLGENLKSKDTWLRLFFIILFAILYGIAEFVATVVVVIQFLWVLFTGERNERLRELGQSLAGYSYQVIRYLTYNSDERPFPIDLDWPSGRPE